MIHRKNKPAHLMTLSFYSVKLGKNMILSIRIDFFSGCFSFWNSFRWWGTNWASSNCRVQDTGRSLWNLQEHGGSHKRQFHSVATMCGGAAVHRLLQHPKHALSSYTGSCASHPGRQKSHSSSQVSSFAIWAKVVTSRNNKVCSQKRVEPQTFNFGKSKQCRSRHYMPMHMCAALTWESLLKTVSIKRNVNLASGSYECFCRNSFA